MTDLLQLLGAALILVPFVAVQLERMTTTSPAYLLPNLVGSVLLAALALEGSQWGFLVLETVWAGVSLWALVTLARGAAPA